MDATRVATEIASTELLLDRISAALLAIVDPSVKTYTLDSGQTVERVERNTLRDLTATQSSLENRLCTLLARQTGSGAVLVVPSGPRDGSRQW